ncbi:MAG: uroporphyrinogen decarboxylase family protein [Caldilineales bacterium]|nr:uroporphyrinogen decarboxylase family protein [Caldilineales bacterium]
MNPYERMSARLQGGPVDRPPNFDIFMTFAARRIGRPLRDYYLDYRALVDANRYVIENFDIDLVQAISDPYRETADFGAEIEFPEDDMPLSKIPLLKEPDDIKKLVRPHPATGKRMSDRLEAIRMFREQVGGEYPIMGWVEGALAEAVDLRNINNLMLDLVMRPEWVEELCEICTEVAIDFARAQIEAGADIIGLGDAVGSLVSPAMYRQFALPYEQRIFATVHEMGALARLHICGNTNKIVGDMVESGADIIDLDYMVDMGAAAAKFGDRVSFCGNFNPVSVMLDGTPEEAYAATLRCMEIGGPRAISAAGCEIPQDTPDENLRAQSHALADFGMRSPAR